MRFVCLSWRAIYRSLDRRIVGRLSLSGHLASSICIFIFVFLCFALPSILVIFQAHSLAFVLLVVLFIFCVAFIFRVVTYAFLV